MYSITQGLKKRNVSSVIMSVLYKVAKLKVMAVKIEASTALIINQTFEVRRY